MPPNIPAFLHGDLVSGPPKNDHAPDRRSIAECVIAFVSYGLDLKHVLAYNAASVAGTGLGTIFRYFSYKKWVFLADTPAAAVAAGEATVSGLTAVTGTREEEALLDELLDTAEASRR